MKRPSSPCFAAGEHRRRIKVRRLHNAAAAAAPLLRRKRTVPDCGFYRTPGPPPEKRPRLEGVNDSHAFLWEVQAAPKEQAFGFQAQ
ncbi:hypothetical protein V5799_026885 [Amblyomma americanum]|uniref:Uncharacterized protein n=1 Tax=Amblyomma americanum TaxID=6943 RepID=A0AAQ4DHB2_AMBAM